MAAEASLRQLDHSLPRTIADPRTGKRRIFMSPTYGASGAGGDRPGQRDTLD
jgi:hypothetical protein